MNQINRSTMVLMAAVILMAISGCDPFGAAPNLRKSSDRYRPVISGYEGAPASVENWFYREFGDQAGFPEFTVDGAMDRMNAVADWVAGIDYTPEEDPIYQTTGETDAAGGGDSSSLAWLCFHAALDAGIDGVSVEVAEWADGTELYVCVWRNAGTTYVIDGGRLVTVASYFDDGGWLVYGFDADEYWTYEVVER
ncbi:hypothetical protein [Desulfosarcina ovata]|nr:hypothetical protein [Desulfosarcina ovata]